MGRYYSTPVTYCDGLRPANSPRLQGANNDQARRSRAPVLTRTCRMLNDAFTLHGLCLMLDMMAYLFAVLPSPSGSVATPEERQQLLRAQDASQAAQRSLSGSARYRSDPEGPQAEGERLVKPTRTSAATPTLSSVHVTSYCRSGLLPTSRRLQEGLVALALRSFPVIRSWKQVFIDVTAALAYFRALGERHQGVETKTQQVVTTCLRAAAKPDERHSLRHRSAIQSDK